jgi:hypothetical protein
MWKDMDIMISKIGYECDIRNVLVTVKVEGRLVGFIIALREYAAYNECDSNDTRKACVSWMRDLSTLL